MSSEEAEMKVVAIAAVDRNGVIGKDNGLPWDIPEDMKFFRASTRDQIVVMGRKSYDSLGKALPKRENAVVTRNEQWQAEGVKRFSDLESAIEYYRGLSGVGGEFADKILFVIGGAEIFKLSLPLVDEIWLTEIDHAFEGDVFFPEYREGKFHDSSFVLAAQKPQQNAESPVRYSFNCYVKR